MLSTPQQNLLQSVILLLCLISGIILIFRSFFQIPDMLTIIVIVIVIYTYSRLVAPMISETMIPELLLLFISILFFRLDEVILHSGLTELITKITSEIIVNLLLVWELVFIIISIATIVILFIQRNLLRFKGQNWLFLIGISFILVIFVLLANIAHYSFTVIDSMSLVFYRSQDIVRIDIIRDCSGIYGIMIFSCSFLLFGTDTKRKTEWDNKQMFLLFAGGVIGVYSLNIFRIITVINASLITDIAFKSFIHSYLGPILILLFVIGYWASIWRKSFRKKENVHLENFA